MERWQNQEEAYQFAMSHPACMLAMDMGTGKTKVAIDVISDRVDVTRVLVVCPKAVLPVWENELKKHSNPARYECYTKNRGKIIDEAKRVKDFITPKPKPGVKKYVIINYDSVWRAELGNVILKANFDMVVLDESHRAKSHRSKVSRFLGLLGKRTKYKLCLTGTPMANSSLDIYGQYRFLDQTIFGTSYTAFLEKYAIMGGPERRFVVGYKNQKDLNERYKTIAYSCSMNDISDRIKLPSKLPPITIPVELSGQDMKLIKNLSKEFIAECNAGMIVLNNVLSRLLRIQQITSGFCMVQNGVDEDPTIQSLNTAKRDALIEYLTDIDINERVVVFCKFRYDLESIKEAAETLNRPYCEISGRMNMLNEWKSRSGAVLAVQIQAGAEGIDLTDAHRAVYFSLPHSLALYDQSKARLYRPGQKNPVSFVHLIVENTVDELIYDTLQRKRDIIEAIKLGLIDFSMLKTK